MIKKNPKKKIVKENDILWSKIIRLLFGICQKCKKTKSTQVAHIFSRSNFATRWEIKNGIGMCYYCHIIWAHRAPIEFAEWIKEVIGLKTFNWLKKKVSDKNYQFDLREAEKINKQLTKQYQKLCQTQQSQNKISQMPY